MEKTFGSVIEFLSTKESCTQLQDPASCTPLHCAASENNSAVFNKLIDDGEDVNLKCCNQITALHLAIQRYHFEAVDKLLTLGPDVNSKDNLGRTPLHFATYLQFDCIQSSVNNGGDTSFLNSKSQASLHASTQDRILSIVSKLIDLGAALETRDVYGFTPFHYAAMVGSIEVVEFLINKGVDINVTDNNGLTSLHCAIQVYRYSKTNKRKCCKFLKTIAVLLDKGIDVNSKDRNGETALHYAAKKGCSYLTDILCEKGASVNSKNNEGQTALHFAAAMIDWKVFNKLLEKKANVYLKNNKDVTPLQILLWYHQYPGLPTTSSFQPPFSFGWREFINTLNKNNITPLQYSITHRALNITNLLLSLGAYIEKKNNEGLTALHFAARTGLKETSLLLESEANPNSKTFTGQTPLHMAISEDLICVALELIDRGAVINMRNSCDQTPLHVALTRKIICVPLVQTMLNNGAKVDYVDIYNKIPLDYISQELCNSSMLKIVVMQHIVKIKALNYNVQIEMDYRRNKSFRDSCLEEIKNLQIEQCGNIILARVFFNYSNPTYVFNSLLEQKLKSSCLKFQYPIYASLLCQTFKQAKKRYRLLNLAQNFFSILKRSQFQLSLPSELEREILFFLNDEDLLNLIDLVRKASN